MFDALLSHPFEPRVFLELSYFPTSGDADLSYVSSFAEQNLFKRYEVTQSGLLVPLRNHSGASFIRAGLDLDSAVEDLIKLPLNHPLFANSHPLLELNVFYQDFSSTGKLLLNNNYSLCLNNKENNPAKEAERLAYLTHLFAEKKKAPRVID